MFATQVILLIAAAAVSATPTSRSGNESTTWTTNWTTEPRTDAPVNVCEEILLTEGNLRGNYGQAIAHRLHSITRDDIRYYFGVDVSDENGITTVSEDMSPEVERVLPNAPSADYDKEILTQAMKQLDKVLSHMDNKDYSIVNYSILEKIAHSFHMSELWARSKLHFDLLSVNPVPEEVCRCLTSPDSDVIPYLELLALKIKFPGLTSGSNPPAAPPKDAAYNIGIGYSFSFKNKEESAPPAAPPANTRKEGFGPADDSAYKLYIEVYKDSEYAKNLRSFDFSGDDADVVSRAQQELVDGDAGLDERLDSEEGWQAWKEGFKSMDDFDNYQFAVYMHCMLQ